MQATLVNDWWMTTNQGGSMGTTNTSGITEKQQHNATKVYNYFSALGWSLSAIAGMIGNMQLESWLSPALVEGTHRSQLPNSASSLSDVPNSVALEHYNHNNHSASGYGLGLVQWDGYTDTAPAGHKLVSFAIRYNLNWYDGDTQLFRIKREQETNIQWSSATVNGTYWTWNNFPTNNETPEISAKIWRICYEVASSGTDSTRQSNARYWYEYFSGSPPVPPTPSNWISGSAFANLAIAYDPAITGIDIPYSTLDCYGFVQKVWRDIPAVSSTDRLVSPQSPSVGTNSLWRMNVSPYVSWEFNTESPAGQNPTPVLWYKSSIDGYLNNLDDLPTGCLLFHKIPEDASPQIPSIYAGDGIGNFAHVGIYVGNNQVMQSGGRDSSTVTGGGVHRTTYSGGITSTAFRQAWNYLAYVVWVDINGDTPPEPPEPPEPTELLNWFLLWYTNKRKGVTKRAKRIY